MKLIYRDDQPDFHTNIHRAVIKEYCREWLEVRGLAITVLRCGKWVIGDPFEGGVIVTILVELSGTCVLLVAKGPELYDAEVEFYSDIECFRNN